MAEGTIRYDGRDNSKREEYNKKIDTIRATSIQKSKVRILNITQNYTIRDVDEIFVDLHCEPYEFNANNSVRDNIAPCLSRINFNTVESSQFKHIVILGLPGAGKTTLLKKIFKEYCSEKHVIPVYIELKQEEKRGRFNILWKCGEKVSEYNIRQYLIKYFEALGITTDDHFFEFIREQNIKIVFFCDGLDEITREQYDLFTKTVQALSIYEYYRFIISSRQVGFKRSDYTDDEFYLYSLMDFNEDKQVEFIEKYYNTINISGQSDALQERKRILIKSLDNASIKRMAKSPILLSLLCVMPDISNINNKAQLFQSAIQVLLNSRTNSQGVIGNPLSLKQQYLIDFLKEIAVVFFKLDKAENFELSELEFYAERCFSQKEDSVKQWLKNNYMSCGLFDKIDEENIGNTYKFAHRTIWEYLVAEGMATNGRDKNEIYNRANMGVWEEPIKMWLPLISQQQPTIQTEIFKELWKRNKALTLSCMSEFDPFPQNDFSSLYGELTKRDKLRLIATLRDSYVNPSSDYRKQVINTIKETLTLIHKVEKDCEVVYNYISFLDEFKNERVFNDLLYLFLDYEHLSDRLEMMKANGLRFVLIPKGGYIMGREKNGNRNPYNDNTLIVDEEETPAHKVRISSDFFISQTLITNKMFYECGFPYLFVKHDGSPVYKHNSYSDRDNQPANYITWYEAMVFAMWLGCTLATEAEWEYACRSADKDSICMTDDLSKLKEYLDKKSCYSANSSNRTREVFPLIDEAQNECHLVDMLGNLREWCLDWYSDDFYKKCDYRYYQNFAEDIKGYDSVTYYFDSDDNPICVHGDIPANVDKFTFDRDGYCIDPIKRIVGDFESKSLRGGCFDWSISNLRPTYRNHNPAINIYKVNGFRLVYKGDLSNHFDERYINMKF